MPPPARDTARNGSAANNHGAGTTGPLRDSSPGRSQQPPAQSHSDGAARPAKKPLVQSPQQIMRARYKQQMMPPRTWRQQEERRKQQEAASRQRLAGSETTMRAAAAAAAANTKNSSPAPQAHQGPQARPAQASRRLERPRSGSLEAAQSANRAPQAPETALNGSAQQQEKQGGAAAPSSRAVRPIVQRRGSSQLSISRAAAIQAQQATQSPHRRESAGSVHSAQSPPHSDSASFSSARSEVLLPSNPTSPWNSAYNPAAAAAPSPSSSSSSATTFTTASSVATAATAAAAPAAASRPAASPMSRRSQRASQFGGVPAPPTPSRSITASAAARASAASPIEITPREPLSSKFVSSLTQALKRELHERQETRTAEERARDNQSNQLEKILGNITSSESFRSVNSVASEGSVGSSGSAASSSAPLQAARKIGASASRRPQHQQSASVELERERKKASALSAALAAGGKAESEMARIHMQVNLAVQDALQTASRREQMKRYRPSSHWSAPVRQLRRPQLKRLATSDSTASAQNNTTESPVTPVVKPWQLMPEGEDPVDSEPPTPVTPSPTQSFGSVPMHPSYSMENVASATSVPSLVKPNTFPSSSAPSSASPASPAAAKSSDTSRWKSWTNSVLNRQRGGSKPKQGRPEEKSLDSRSALPQSVETRQTSSPTPSATYLPPGLAGQPPVTRQEPMLHTLRGRTMRNKRFNEDKPWKNHQGLYYLSETERKRYEKLWAANRCTHLPFLYLNPAFEGLWHAAVSRRFPHLYKKEQSSDQDSLKTTGSANSHLQASPISWNHDRGDTASMSSSFGARRSFEYTRSAGTALSRSVSGGSALAPSRSPYGAAEPIAVESVENIINAGDLHEHMQPSVYASESGAQSESLPDREISPESVISGETKERELEEGLEARSPLDELHSVASSIEKDVEKQAEDVHGYVVSRLWRRSRLPEETLAEIWDLVDTNRDGTLDRSSFVVGMWLCDQCLYGRKLPARVPYEVWQSVGKLHLKVRFKQPKSKIWYMTQLPNFMGSAVGHTMHGGRQAVKKVVQTATS